MLTRTVAFVASCTALLALPVSTSITYASCTSFEGNPSQLATAVYQRPDGRDLLASGNMILTVKGGAERERSFRLYRRDAGPSGELQALIRFYTPSKIRGTGLLIDTATDGSWIYLPALDRIRRISRKNRGGRFVQSQLYYEDLENRHPSEDTHKLLPDDEYEGISTYLLESTPIDASTSAYSKRLSWIHPELLIPLRVDFYEGGSEPTKRLIVTRVDQVSGYWTVTDSKVTDLQRGDSTTMRLRSITYDSGLSADVFTPQSLSSPDSDPDVE